MAGDAAAGDSTGLAGDSVGAATLESDRAEGTCRIVRQGPYWARCETHSVTMGPLPRGEDDSPGAAPERCKLSGRAVEYRGRYCGSKRPHAAHEHSLVEGVVFRCRGKVSA